MHVNRGREDHISMHCRDLVMNGRKICKELQFKIYKRKLQKGIGTKVVQLYYMFLKLDRRYGFSAIEISLRTN